MNTQIPENVALIISGKKAVLESERKTKEKQDLEKRLALIAKGREMLRVRLNEIIPGLPEWIRSFDVTESQYDDDTLVRVGEGYVKLTSMNLVFEISGLADIQFSSKDNTLRSAQARGSQWGDEKPSISFYNDCYWRTDLEYVLIEAQEAYQRFVEFQKTWEDLQEQRRKEEQEHFERDTQNELKFDEQINIKQTEEQKLFDVFKDDPIAIALMKAFLMVRQEREMFEQRIEESDQVTYSLEERLSRKAEELRRELKSAEQQIEDEHRRASDLEDDLSKEKKKSKTQSW